MPAKNQKRPRYSKSPLFISEYFPAPYQTEHFACLFEKRRTSIALSHFTTIEKDLRIGWKQYMLLLEIWPPIGIYRVTAKPNRVGIAVCLK